MTFRLADTETDAPSQPEPADDDALVDSTVDTVARVTAWLAELLDDVPDELHDRFPVALAAVLEQGEADSIEEAIELAIEVAGELEPLDDEDHGDEPDDDQAELAQLGADDQPRVPAGDSDGGQFAPADGGGSGTPSKESKSGGEKKKGKGLGQKAKDAVKSIREAPGKIAKAIKEKGVVGATVDAGKKVAGAAKAAAKSMEDSMAAAGVNRKVAKAVAVAAAVIATTPISVGVVGAAAGVLPAAAAAIPGAVEAGAIVSGAKAVGKAIRKAKEVIKKVRARKPKAPKALPSPVAESAKTRSNAPVIILRDVRRVVSNLHGMSSEAIDLLTAEPLPLVAGKYQWRIVPDGLLVFGVEVMSFVSSDERPHPDMTADWFARVIKTWEIMEAKGKKARALERHNNPWGEPAEVIGRLLNGRWHEPWLTSEVLFTRPDAQGKASRGEYPSRSAEYWYETAHVWGLSFINGAEGHFEEELPDFVLAPGEGLDELKRLGAGDSAPKLRSRLVTKPLTLATDADKQNLDGQPPPAAPEKPAQPAPEKPKEMDLAEWTQWRQGIESRLQNLENLAKAAQNPTTAPAAPQQPAGQMSADEAKRLTADNARLSTELATTRLELWIERETAKLLDGGCRLTREQIRAQLLEPKTEEGRKERAASLANVKAPPTDDLPPDPKIGKPDAKAEYAALKAEAERLGRTLPFSEADYVKSSALHA